jgi:hypothetical protein
MFAFLIRCAGYLALIAGLVVGTLDVARSVSAGAFKMQVLGEMLFNLLGERYLLLQPAVERHVSETVWNWLVLPLTLQPALVVLFVLGLLLVALGWRRRQPLAA